MLQHVGPNAPDRRTGFPRGSLRSANRQPLAIGKRCQPPMYRRFRRLFILTLKPPSNQGPALGGSWSQWQDSNVKISVLMFARPSSRLRRELTPRAAISILSLGVHRRPPQQCSVILGGFHRRAEEREPPSVVALAVRMGAVVPKTDFMSTAAVHLRSRQ